VLAFVLRRFAFSLFVIAAGSAVLFFAVSAVGDPLGQLREQPGISQQTIENITERKHLDEPLVVQYGYWAHSVVADGFGTTLMADRPIWPDLRRALSFTLQIVVAAEVLAIGVAIVLGVATAKRQYSIFDNLTTFGAFLGFAVPVFWLALILQVIFTNLYHATDVRIVYTSGVRSPHATNFLIDRLQHLALPVVALSVNSIAQYSRYMRASMLEVLNSDFVRTARAKGLAEWRVTIRHSLRNALLPLTTVVGFNLGVVFGGSILVETIFGIPGMGRYFFSALLARDVYPIMAWFVVTGVLIVVFVLITDILYAYLDPRIRLE
jgi:peptide/nickel transport system permease protein